jgi:hypothetical protein
MSTSKHLLMLLAPGTSSKEAASLERDDLADERFRRDCEKADDAPGSDEFSDDEFLSCDSNGGA